MKKELQKKLSFVLFVMAVFFAGVALTVFSSSVVVIAVAGVILLATAVFFVLQQDAKSQTPSGKTSEILLADRMAELMRGNEKAEKGVYIAVKKQHEAMEEGLASLEEKISELIKSQDNAVKTLVLYNKENAKQMALSEREELGRLREELVKQNGKGGQGSMSQVADAVKDMSRRLYEEFHETGEAILAELESSTDSLEEIKNLIQGMGSGSVPQYVPNAPISEEVPEPMIEEPLFEEPEEVDVPEPVMEESEEMFEEPVEEGEPVAEEVQAVSEDPNRMLSADDIAALFAAAEPEGPAEEELPVAEETPVVSEDPNRMLSADDIAALFAAAESQEPVVEEAPVVMEEPAVEEAPAKKNPEDALASSGVDLSDPNKTLSPDDIAALIAALGN